MIWLLYLAPASIVVLLCITYSALAAIDQSQRDEAEFADLFKMGNMEAGVLEDIAAEQRSAAERRTAAGA